MYWIDVTLYGFSLIALVVLTVSLFTKGLVFKPTGFLPVIISILHFVLFGFHYIAVPAYAASALILLIQLLKKPRVLKILAVLSAAAMLAAPLLVHTLYVAILGNYTSMGYAEAFKALNNTLKEQYPFARWKGIDFDETYEHYIELFREADRSGSRDAYYKALRNYIRSIPDGHLQLAHADNILFERNSRWIEEAAYRDIGGCYGFTALKTEGGKVLTGLVEKGSDAERAGLETGMEILNWKGLPIRDVAKTIPFLWFKKTAASPEHHERLQYSLLTRGPVGESAELSFRDRTGSIRTALLTAHDDKMALYNRDLDIFYHKGTETNLTGRVIGRGHGYIRLNAMPEDKSGEACLQLARLVEDLKAQGIQDLILDMRSNTGGYDSFGARCLGLFIKEEMFYQAHYAYSLSEGLSFGHETRSVPSGKGFNLPIVIMVNNHCMSAGEGFVYNAGRLPNVSIAGMTGTNGSFGDIDGVVLMPENLMVFYPQSANCDEQGTILIDTDVSGNGGIQPDIRIPLSEEAVLRLYRDGEDYELSYVLHFLDRTQ